MTGSLSFKTISILEGEDSLRLDCLLKKRFEKYSRSYFQELISSDLVLLNDKPIKKRIKPKVGDEIKICFKNKKPLDLIPENIPLDILYEDNYLIAVNKPPGMVVHPAPGNWTHTFVNALLSYCNELSDPEDYLRPGIVHRLDKETSGVLIAAKTNEMHQYLVEKFSKREMQKQYIAICLGRATDGVINAPIARHPKERKKMAIVVDKGKEAITEVKCLACNGHLSKVQFYPRTGRTHQIRVHMQYNQTPILGDSLYGNSTLNKKYGALRHYLHAEKLTFEHPITKKLLEFYAPIPSDIEEAFLCAF